MPMLIACVGNSDLMLDGQYLAVRNHSGQLPSFREQTRALLAEGDTILSRLDAPLLRPLVAWLLDRRAKDQTPLQIVLLATDQDPPHPQDTVFAAQLLERWLLARFPQSSVACARDKLSGNPSDYDAMYRAIRRVLQTLKPGEPPIYLSLTAGTPAMTFALTVHALDLFGSHCSFLYLPRGSETPRELRVRRWLQQAALLADARRELQRGEFGRAAVLLRQAGVPNAFAQLAEAADHRLAYHFEEATTTAKQAQRDPRTRSVAQEFLRELEELEAARRLLDEKGGQQAVPHAYEPLLSELVANLRLAWENDREADFLARLYRFHEAMLRWLVEEQLAAPVHTSSGDATPAFRRWWNARPELQRRAAARNLNPERITRPLLDFLIADIPALKRDREVLRNLNRLTQLRSQTIVGHGFLGVRRDDILKAYRNVAGPQADPMRDVEELAQRLQLGTHADWPQRLRATLLELLTAWEAEQE